LKICRLFTLLALVCACASAIHGQSASQFLATKLPDDKSVSGHFSESPVNSVPGNHGSLFSSDGTCLFYRYWISASEPDPEFIVLLLHGIGLHSGRYEETAEELNKSGVAVYAVDTRGHGLSCGKRGSIPDSATENGDLSSMLATIRQIHPKAKLFLMAESMGGAFALNYAMSNPTEISGMILMSPVFTIDSGQWMHFGTWRYLPDYLFRRNAPVVSLLGRTGEPGKINTKAVSAHPEDKLALTRVSINYLLAIHHAVVNWKNKAPKVHIATLVMEGEHDPVAKPGSVRQLFDLLNTHDKQFKLWPDVTHSLLGNVHSPDILHGVCAWITQH
jgi:alpha-beta hydrolase superfamily lysophospholipase